MPLYDNSGRLRQDRCAIDEQELANRGVSQYVLTNLRPRPDKSAGVVQDLQQKHRNFRAWDGYGWNVARIDTDSRMRMGSVATHSRARMQLNKRVFTAAPDMAMASALPDPFDDDCSCDGLEESDSDGYGDDIGLLEGTNIGTRGCNSRAAVSEADYNRFDPGYCPPAQEHIIGPWVAGGAMSRDIARSRKFKKLLRRGGDMKHWMKVASGLETPRLA